MITFNVELVALRTADVSTVASPARAVAEADGSDTADSVAKEQDVERFSKLPIENRTVPAEKWEEEILNKKRRIVPFPHIGLHCRSRVGQTKEPWPFVLPNRITLYGISRNFLRSLAVVYN